MPQVCSMERDTLTYTGYVVVRGGVGETFPSSGRVLSVSRHRAPTNHRHLSVSFFIQRHTAVTFRRSYTMQLLGAPKMASQRGGYAARSCRHRKGRSTAFVSITTKDDNFSKFNFTFVSGKIPRPRNFQEISCS